MAVLVPGQPQRGVGFVFWGVLILCWSPRFGFSVVVSPRGVCSSCTELFFVLKNQECVVPRSGEKHKGLLLGMVWMQSCALWPPLRAARAPLGEGRRCWMWSRSRGTSSLLEQWLPLP